MKTKEHYVEEYIEHLYGDIEEHERPMYAPDIAQSKKDFEMGFYYGQPKWISVETPPDDERNVIIKIFDYRRPKENVTEVGLGYFDHEEKEWYHTSDVLVNGGHGWMITHYMEIPQ